jgi:hypothetical protein
MNPQMVGLAEPHGRRAPNGHNFPYTIAWTTLPCISWILPSIGHTGICGSNGEVHDFAGPYMVNVDCMMCGPPKKIWQLRIEDMGKGKTPEDFDRAVAHGDQVYSGRMHNLFCDNCHSHVACALNEMSAFT